MHTKEVKRQRGKWDKVNQRRKHQSPTVHNDGKGSGRDEARDSSLAFRMTNRLPRFARNDPPSHEATEGRHQGRKLKNMDSEKASGLEKHGVRVKHGMTGPRHAR